MNASGSHVCLAAIELMIPAQQVTQILKVGYLLPVLRGNLSHAFRLPSSSSSLTHVWIPVAMSCVMVTAKQAVPPFPVFWWKKFWSDIKRRPPALSGTTVRSWWATGAAESSAGPSVSSPAARRPTTGWRTSWWTAAPPARSASPWRSDATTAGTAGSSSVRGQLRAQPRPNGAACEWEICLWVCVRFRTRALDLRSFVTPHCVLLSRFTHNNVVPSEDT